MAPHTLPRLPFLINPRRHDEDPPDTPPPTTPPPADPANEGDEDPPETDPAKTTAKKAAPKPPQDPPGDGVEGLGDAGKRALAREREQRRAAAQEAAEAHAALEAANRKIQAFEDEKRSELEKAQAAAERAAERERAANLRAVTADIRSYAISADAVDPSDIVDVLTAKNPDRFLTDQGIDSASIETAVAELLEKKPHWRKATDPGDDGAAQKKKRSTPPPAPDPGQGSKPPGSPNWDDPVAFAAEAKRLGLRTYR